MKVVIQRVSRASVLVDGNLVSSIGPGYCILVGVGHGDDKTECEFMVNKILNTKLFASSCGTSAWKQSLLDVQGQILSVSQFTLYAKTNKGTKVDFHHAMKTENAKELYSYFLERLRQCYRERHPKADALTQIQDGQFGAMMEVNIANDGPVTILLETSAAQPKKG